MMVTGRDGVFRGTGRDHCLTGPGTIPGYFTPGQMEYFGMVNRGFGVVLEEKGSGGKWEFR